MKSYYEIVGSAKLTGFEDSTVVAEYYRDSEYTYVCIWMPENNTLLPSTIYATANSPTTTT